MRWNTRGEEEKVQGVDTTLEGSKHEVLVRDLATMEYGIVVGFERREAREREKMGLTSNSLYFKMVHGAPQH